MALPCDAVSWACLQFVIAVFPDYTHLLFLNTVPKTMIVIYCRVLLYTWLLLLFIYQNKACRIKVTHEHMCISIYKHSCCEYLTIN